MEENQATSDNFIMIDIENLKKLSDDNLYNLKVICEGILILRSFEKLNETIKTQTN